MVNTEIFSSLAQNKNAHVVDLIEGIPKYVTYASLLKAYREFFSFVEK